MDRARAWALRLTLALTVLGLVLSTLHQSSLGSLFLIAPGKLHPLWYSPFLPIYFFVSAVVAGLSMVIVESALSHRYLHARAAGGSGADLDSLTLGLGKAAAVVLYAYLFGRVVGLVQSGAWTELESRYGALYLVELGGFVALPCLLYALGVRHARVRLVRAAAVLGVLGVVLNRLNVSFIGFTWKDPTPYVPHWMEVAISLCVITVGILVFRFVVNRMPVLAPHPRYGTPPHE
jgi:Ni/Fe-hydrogenase subunit HybB-like protein